MNVMIIHQHCPISGRNGGVETFLQDLLVHMPNEIDASIVCSRHVHLSFIKSFDCKSYTNRSKLPETVLTVMRLIFHVRRISLVQKVIFVNRFEYVIAAKLLYPRSRVHFFKHTVGRLNESKSSDSIWRKMPHLYRTFEGIAFSLASRVWTFDQSDLTRGRDVHWVHLKPSADLALFHSKTQKNNHVSWIGRLETPKNPLLGTKLLLELFVRGYKTVLVGTGSLQDVVKNYEAAGGLLKSNLDKREVASLLGDTRVLIMTSDFEAAPRVMIEALSSGCFIVCTPMSDPNGLRLEFPSRIFYFNSFDQAINLIIFLATKQSDYIDLNDYENEVQFRKVWTDILNHGVAS
jgi:hypothetical protein